jgi:hypothetical protein
VSLVTAATAAAVAWRSSIDPCTSCRSRPPNPRVEAVRNDDLAVLCVGPLWGGQREHAVARTPSPEVCACVWGFGYLGHL